MSTELESLDHTRAGHILLVDDDPGVQRSLAYALQSEGYSVSSSGDGQEALRIIQQEHIDVVLLDLTLPALPGWDVFERLTALEPCMPVVIITARSDQSEKAAVAGATALLEKPISVPDLVALLERLTHESFEERARRILGQCPLYGAGSKPDSSHRPEGTGARRDE